MARGPKAVRPIPAPEQAALPEPTLVDLGFPEIPQPRLENGVMVSEQPDGGALIDFSPTTSKSASDRFSANLALEMEDSELNKIASDLIEGIERDNQSRSEWLDNYAEGIKLLGLVLENNTTSMGSSAAPLEGMSNARHPLLLESCLWFQANARGELLPAAGPVKVRDDRPPKPQSIPGMGHNGGPPLDPMGATPFSVPPQPPLSIGAQQPLPPQPIPAPANGAAMAGHPPLPPATNPGAPPLPPQPSAIPGLPMPQPDEQTDRSNLADALETDFNHYLTTTAKEYYPDTDRMLFTVGFGGQGIKKVYNCPLRRRPVSESVPMEDFIVSDAMTDLGNAARITHKIRMRPSTVRRMQLLGVYRDTNLGTPTNPDGPTSVDQAKAAIAGVQPQVQDPKDADYELLECYCELDLDRYAPRQFKGKGLALPYRVTMERQSRKILEITRNWREGDKECMAREFFVDFSYDKAFGFYGIGLLHILGNLTRTLTAAQRITTDNGMFANFPGFIYAKGAGRQLTNQFRVPPAGGVGLDVGLQKLSDAVMPLPYKDVSTAWVAWQKQMEDMGRALGGAANIAVGEGRADAPVGTTLALIEQSTKPLGAALKRMHSAQAKEFQLLADRFRDDPEAFWRFNRKPMMAWQKEQFIKALNDFDLVPVSDPNNPTKMHRAAKSAALQQIAIAAPGLLNPQKVFKRVAASLEIDDADELLAPIMPPSAPPIDPAKMASANAKAQGDQIRAQTDIATASLDAQSKKQEMDTRLQIAYVEQETERLRLAGTFAIHADKAEGAERLAQMRFGADRDRQMRDHIHDHAQNVLERQQSQELAAQQRMQNGGQ